MTASNVRDLGSGRMAGMRRTPAGRHRHGRPATELGHREWDTAQKARAAQLDLLEPGWLILYGPYCRRFYAIARMDGVTELLVEASGPDELRTLMRQAETAPPRASRHSDTCRRLAPVHSAAPGARTAGGRPV